MVWLADAIAVVVLLGIGTLLVWESEIRTCYWKFRQWLKDRKDK